MFHSGVLLSEAFLTSTSVHVSRMSRVFDNGGDLRIRRMRVGSINLHYSSPQHSQVLDYYDSDEDIRGMYLRAPGRGRSRNGSRSRSPSRERAGYGEGGQYVFLA